MLNMTVMFKDWMSTGRREKGLTLEVLGRKAGTHKGYISGILNEKVNPPAKGICAKLAKIFSVPAEYVIFMAYRDKAPIPVRNRIGYLESLRESIDRFRAISSDTTGPADVCQAQRTAAWQEVCRLLATLEEMWPSSTGNGHKQ